MDWPKPVRIIGVGSPHGDDALAWEVVGQLRGLCGELPDVEYHVVGGGQRLLDLLDGEGSVLLIDAIAGANEPGMVQRFDWPDARLDTLQPGSTHGLRPAETLQLAAALGVLPRKVVIFGIQVLGCETGAGLSAAVAAALPQVVQRVASELLGACTPVA
jgi:hydrogenase maturation protease